MACGGSCGCADCGDASSIRPKDRCAEPCDSTATAVVKPRGRGPHKARMAARDAPDADRLRRARHDARAAALRRHANSILYDGRLVVTPPLFESRAEPWRPAPPARTEVPLRPPSDHGAPSPDPGGVNATVLSPPG